MAILGRPTEYDESFCAEVERYLESCVDEPVTVDFYRVKLPSIEGLSLWLGVSRQRIYDWAEKHEDFRDMIEKVRGEQANRLLNNGLSGIYNPTITKLVLNKHGYVEKKELEVESKNIMLDE